jgi:hypothetical protein
LGTLGARSTTGLPGRWKRLRLVWTTATLAVLQLEHETDAWSRLTAAIGRVLEKA